MVYPLHSRLWFFYFGFYSKPAIIFMAKKWNFTVEIINSRGHDLVYAAYYFLFYLGIIYVDVSFYKSN